MIARTFCVVASTILLAGAPAAAQSLRATGATSLRYIELRTLMRDSVAADSVPGSGILRQLADGRVVRCIPGERVCRDTRPGDVVSTVPVIHDVELSAWGFGTGVRAFAQIRARELVSGNPDLWPRTDDALDLLSLFAEVERPRVRVRAGRQWKISGLGFYNFDGIDVDLKLTDAAAFEAYAGRSLVRGLNEGRTAGALESIESLANPSTGVLLGAHARYRPTPRIALSALYQIDFRADGRGLYSELAAANGVFSLPPVSAEAALEVDVATGNLNQAALQLRVPPLGSYLPFFEIRRYRPYFELWTIWGAFSPVGFDEARATLTWGLGRHNLVMRGEASYRSYQMAGLEEGPADLRTDGWGAGGFISWTPVRAWHFESSYRVESGNGAARRDGGVAAVRQIGSAGSLALQGLVFQSLYEFRLTEGTVMGLGAEAQFPLSPQSQLFASALLYRHLNSEPQSGLDWNQRRLSVRVQWTLGREPGLPVAERGR